MPDTNNTVINHYNNQVMEKLIDITERIARVEEKVVSSSDIEKAVDKLEDKIDARLSKIESDMRRIDSSINFIEKSSKPPTPIAMKITAIGSAIAIIIGLFTIVGMINDNTRNQARIQQLEQQVQENKNDLGLRN